MRSIRLMAASIWSPAEAFREILESGVRPWVPVAVHILAGVLLIAVLISRVDLGAMIAAQAAQSQGANMNEEAQEAMSTLFNSPVATALIASTPVLTVPIMFLFVAGIYFGMFLILGSTARYGQYLSLTSFAFTPHILNAFVLVALTFVSRPTSLDPSMLGSVSPAVFMTPEAGQATQGPLYVAAGSLNLFTIWVLVLLVIAFKRVVSRRTSTGAVSVAVLTPWLVYVLARVGFAALAR